MKKLGRHDRNAFEAMKSGVPITTEEAKAAFDAALSEAQIQRRCIEWFRLSYPQLWKDGVLFHIPNEGKRSLRNGRSLVDTGLVRGVADLCLALGRHGFHALYIEMKKQGSYQRPSQKEWAAGVTKYGNKYVVCRSLDEFIGVIKEYLSVEIR